MLNDFEKTIMSQNGEDGIIEEIFNRIGTEDRIFVEFGVETGLQCNTAHLSRNHGWSGMLIEGSSFMYEQLKNNYRDFANINAVSHFITAENIAKIFYDNAIPKEFDLLSIDIDGNDYWVWKALSEYKPRVVVIEYNAFFAPALKWVMKYNPNHNWDGTSYHGASLESLYLLGNKLGYSLVGTDLKGVNAFFVRKDVVGGKFKELTAEEAYHPARYYGHLNYGNYGHPYRYGDSEEI